MMFMICDHAPEELRVALVNMAEINENEIKDGMTATTLAEYYINKKLKGLDVESHEILENGTFVIWYRVKPVSVKTVEPIDIRPVM